MSQRPAGSPEPTAFEPPASASAGLPADLPAQILTMDGLRPSVSPRSRVADVDPLVSLALSLGLGLALAPLWALWSSRLLPAGPWRGPGALALALLLPPLVWLLRAVLARQDQAPSRDLATSDAATGGGRGALACLLLLLVLAALTRFGEIRGLSVPLFGDSVHHSMIVRLFQLQGGLPADWQPFAPLSSFSYHFGFHAQAAGLAALFGLDAPRAVLVLGQLLMVLQCLSLYALAAGLTGRSWAGLGAALAAAGLSPMPATYLNWGRYTQLAGQVLLPLALLACLRATAAGRPPGAPTEVRDGRRLAAMLAAAFPPSLLAAGLFLTHYLVLGFFGLALLAWLGWEGVATRFGGPFRARLLQLTVIGGLALVLVAPWLPQLAQGAILPAAAALGTGKVADPDVYGVLPDAWAMWRPDALGRNVGWPLILAAGLALLTLAWPAGEGDRGARAVARGSAGEGGREGEGACAGDGASGGLPVSLGSRRLGLWALAWLGLLLLAAYPRLVGLPITGVLKDFTLAIAAYLPLGLVVGAGLAALAEQVAARARRAAPLLVPAALVLVAWLAWQGRARRDDSHRLVFPDDLAALAWIREETPENAGFLVSSFAAFGQTVQAGDDAGWWLTQLAAPRRSTLPPITVGLEASTEPGYRESVNRLAELWREDLDSPETLDALRAAGVGYAFVGVSGKALDRAGLAASPCWTPRFSADADPADERPGAVVYALGPPGCEAAGAAP